MELGNFMFNTNQNQQYDCPNYIIALLKEIDNQLLRIMWNKNHKEYESPFGNTGNKFFNKVFQVQAYEWNEDIEQQFNFKYKDIKSSWYKYLGRDTTINKEITPEEAADMFNDCIDSLKEDFKEEY